MAAEDLRPSHVPNFIRAGCEVADERAFPSRPYPSSPAREAAERACATFFAKTAAAGPLGESDRQAVIDAVIDVLPWENDRRNPAQRGRSAHLHLLCEGWAYCAHTLPDGARQITDILLPGDLCDWSAISFNSMDHDVRACGPARVAVLRKEALGGSERPRLQRRWDWSRDDTELILRSRLISLGRRDARERMAHLFSELHHRLHRIGLADQGSFLCPFTQEQLADVLGLTSVHVNRTLQRLRAEGLLAFNKRRIAIPDLAGLHEVAGVGS